MSEAGLELSRPQPCHSGNGVWKVEAIGSSTVLVTSAANDETSEHSLATFLTERAEPFADGGIVVDQPFLPLVSEGMIRCYVSALSEINVNSVSPSPGAPVGAIAATLANRIGS